MKFLKLTLFFLLFNAVQAQSTINLNASEAMAKASLFFSPAAGSFLVGGTFDVSIMVDTHGSSINTIEANIKFPADKLQIVRPTSGRSIISLWLDQPHYSNDDGTINFAGGILGGSGINTSSGVISTVTFRAIGAGKAIVQFSPNSKVLAGDGLGTDVASDFGTGVYDLSPRPPAGPRIFSETHPFESRWYNNKSPVISWQKDLGVTDFSYILDKDPGTIPDNTVDTHQTTAFFQNLSDGIWYFHLKAEKEGVWGGTSHFLVRIDTAPPAQFIPTVDIIEGGILPKVLVSFLTTDSASGIDHYEAAVIGRTDNIGGSPVFVEAQSPYQLPRSVSGDIRVIVRATDKAGNVRDEFADVNIKATLLSFLIKNIVILLIIALGLVSGLSTEHFLYGHRIIAKLKLIWEILRGKKSFYEDEDNDEINQQIDFPDDNTDNKEEQK